MAATDPFMRIVKGTMMLTEMSSTNKLVSLVPPIASCETLLPSSSSESFVNPFFSLSTQEPHFGILT